MKQNCCGLKWYIILVLATLFTIVAVAAAAVAIVFILSKQEVSIEGGIEKRNIQISGGTIWQESKEDDVRFNGEVEFKNNNELVKGNLTIQKHVSTLKHEFEKTRLIEEHSTIRVALQMSTLLAAAVVVMIGVGCIAKNKGNCKRTKITSGHVQQVGSKNEEQHEESKCNDKGVEKKAIKDRVAEGVRKLDQIEIPRARTPERIEAPVISSKIEGTRLRCFSCFSSPAPCNGTHLSFTRCNKCFLEAKPCREHV